MKKIMLCLVLVLFGLGFAQSKSITQYTAEDRYLIRLIVETSNAQYELFNTFAQHPADGLYEAHSAVEDKNFDLQSTLAHRKKQGTSSKIFSDEKIAEIEQWSMSIMLVNENAIAELLSDTPKITVRTLMLLYNTSNYGLDLIR